MSKIFQPVCACRMAPLTLLLTLASTHAVAGQAAADAHHDPEADAPYVIWDATPAITMTPLLLDVSDHSVIVAWTTDSDADGSVRYGEEALDHTAVAQHDGLVDVGTFHRVVIDGLQPGHRYQYQIASRRVVALKPYWPERGGTVHGQVHRFTTLDTGRPTARFAVITDTHEKVPDIHAMLDSIKDGPVDFVVHDGDTVNYATGEQQLKDVFMAPVAHDLDGQVPLLYVRGNHEYRGLFARALGPYLHAQDDRYDYTRDDGPLHLLVVDTGEDKPDATNVYAGLNDMTDYRRAMFARFRTALAEPRTASAPFTVILGHQKDFGWLDGSDNAWMKAANAADVDLMIAGHEHVFAHLAPGAIGNDFPILVVGQDQVARVEADAHTLHVTLVDTQGKVIDRFDLARRAKRIDKAGH